MLPQHAVPMAFWVCMTLPSQMREGLRLGGTEHTDYRHGLCHRLSGQLLAAHFLSDPRQVPLWVSVYL